MSIRDRLLKRIKSPNVLDCFAGSGRIRREVYVKCKYTGLDLDPVENSDILKIDNIKFLRSQNLSEFNMFDLDAYGSPWRQFITIMSRKTFTQNTGFALTESLFGNPRHEPLPLGMKPFVGIPKKMYVPHLVRHRHFFPRLMVYQFAKNNNLKISDALTSNNGKMTYYYGFILSPK